MTGPDSILTEAAVRDLARPQSYDRRETYYDEGAVVEIVRRGETIRAAVEGSQYEPYQVRIELDETGVVDTACFCPYDHRGGTVPAISTRRSVAGVRGEGNAGFGPTRGVACLRGGPARRKLSEVQVAADAGGSVGGLRMTIEPR
jgi:hypothetical protein